MVCTRAARHEIEGVLAVKTIEALRPTWIGHRYSCRYTFRTGVIVVSVKQLADQAATDAYFVALRDELGSSDAAGTTTDNFVTTRGGSVVVRKDFKVLLVDTSGLPPTFGVRARSRADVAADVATTVLHCWTGD